MSVISSKRIYKNFGECIFLDNGIITLGVTLEEGPRIISVSYTHLDVYKRQVYRQWTSCRVS